MARGCSVFVGNIDFDIPEDQITKELSTIGKVVNFRMVYDRTTGKSKGYGFCEYETPLIAEAAVQNLKISFNNRPVKINYAESDFPSKTKETPTQPETLEIEGIVNVLENMDKNNLKEVILYLKRMAVDQPSKLKELLENNNGLVVAIFQALINLNLIESSVVHELLKKSFNLNDHKAQALERVCRMSDEDMLVYPEEVRNKVIKLKNSILKKSKEK